MGRSKAMIKRLKETNLSFSLNCNPFVWQIRYARASFYMLIDFGPFSMMMVW